LKGLTEAIIYIMDETEKGREAEEEAVTGEFWEIRESLREGTKRICIGQFLVRFTGEFWEIWGHLEWV